MTADQNFALPDAELARLEANFPARAVALSGGGSITVRSCGTGPAVVCLHGIGSGAASWLGTAMDLADQAQVIAWDAPGYGESTPVAPNEIDGADNPAGRQLNRRGEIFVRT